jgi:chlorite dismutase
MNHRFFNFVGGDKGEWCVRQQFAVSGQPLANVQCVSYAQELHVSSNASWVLPGVSSNERYVERSEKEALAAKQEGLGRPEARYAALIPIRKNVEWWAMTQDERRAVFETQSRHIGIGMKYLPAISRKLHHCRDLQTSEPFDFITWFEYAPEHEPQFDDMLTELRASAEWRFVEREVDIRLQRR